MSNSTHTILKVRLRSLITCDLHNNIPCQPTTPTMKIEIDNTHRAFLHGDQEAIDGYKLLRAEKPCSSKENSGGAEYIHVLIRL